MKKFLIICLSLFFAANLYAKQLQELVVTTTPPMSCQNCEKKIKGNLRFEDGIKKIETNLSEQRVTIEYDADKTNPENIENAFQKIGYKVEVISPENSEKEIPSCSGTTSCSQGSSCCKSKDS